MFKLKAVVQTVKQSYEEFFFKGQKVCLDLFSCEVILEVSLGVKSFSLSSWGKRTQSPAARFLSSSWRTKTR